MNMSDVPPADDSQVKLTHQKPGEEIPEKKCLQCDATKTPMWRNGPSGNKTLCNACGVRLYRQQSKVPKKGEAADDVEDVPLEGQAKATYLEYVRKMKAATTKDEIESVGLEMQARTDIFSPEIQSEIRKRVDAELFRIQPISLRKAPRSKRPRETFGTRTSGSDLDGWRNGGTGPNGRSLKKLGTGLSVSEDGHLSGVFPWDGTPSPSMSHGHDIYGIPGLPGGGLHHDNLLGFPLGLGSNGLYAQPGLGKHFSQEGGFSSEGTTQSPTEQYRINSFYERGYPHEALLPSLGSGNTLGEDLLDMDFLNMPPGGWSLQAELEPESHPFTPGPHVISPHANQSTQTAVMTVEESQGYFESTRIGRIASAGCGHDSPSCAQTQTPSSRRSNMSSPDVAVGAGTPQNRLHSGSPRMQQYVPMGVPNQNAPAGWEGMGNPRGTIPSSSGGLPLYSSMNNKSVQFTVSIQPSSLVPRLPVGTQGTNRGTPSMGLSPRVPAGGLTLGTFPGARPLPPINIGQGRQGKMASASPRSCTPGNSKGTLLKLPKPEMPMIPGPPRHAVPGTTGAFPTPVPHEEVLVEMLGSINSPVARQNRHVQDPRELNLKEVDDRIQQARACVKDVVGIDTVLSEKIQQDYAMRTCNGQKSFPLMFIGQVQSSGPVASPHCVGAGPRSPSVPEHYGLPHFPPGHMETLGLETLGAPMGNKLGAPMGNAIGGVTYGSSMAKLEDGMAGNRCGEAAPRSPLLGIPGAAQGPDAQPHPLGVSTPPAGGVSGPYGGMHVPTLHLQ